MLKCPSCDATLDQDFGMVTCSSCKAVLMIDISGQVQMASDTPPEPVESFTDPEDFEEEEPSPIEDHDFAEDELTDPIEEPADQDYQQDEQEFFASSTDEADDIESFEEPVEEPTDDFDNDFFEEAEPEESQFEEPDTPMEAAPVDESEDEPLAEQEPVETFPMASEPDPMPVDVTEFSNSEDSGLDGGELVYDLTIAGIDSKELREDVKYCLMDEKLKLNHHEFLREIKSGSLLIPDLNPIKAKRIVEQLQFSDLDIKWRQKRVTIEVVEPEVEDVDSGSEDEVGDAEL